MIIIGGTGRVETKNNNIVAAEILVLGLNVEIQKSPIRNTVHDDFTWSGAVRELEPKRSLPAHIANTQPVNGGRHIHDLWNLDRWEDDPIVLIDARQRRGQCVTGSQQKRDDCDNEV